MSRRSTSNSIGSLRPGERVEIFRAEWLEAEVDHVADDSVRIIFCEEGSTKRKTLHVHDHDLYIPSETTPPKLQISPKFRGMSAAQFEDFFKEHCGDIIEGVDDLSQSKLSCLPSKLALLCVRANQAYPKPQYPYEPNLYAVNDLLIKPHTQLRSTSYAEMLNPLGKLIKFFISHHWAENFAEFVQSLLRHAAWAAPSAGMAWRELVYWCCAFANNQHKVELGATLEQSPFHLALTSRGCEGTVLNLNSMASALFRVWCDYEAFLTYMLGKPFVVNTCQGPISDPVNLAVDSAERDAWVVSLFQLLQEVDVKKADSSDDNDKKKIMGAIRQFRGKGAADGKVGSDALNTTLRAALASQAMFVLVRKGKTDMIKKALELGVDPDEPDSRGLRPLTYATAIHGASSEVAKALMQGGARMQDPNVAVQLLRMFDGDEEQREEAIQAMKKLGLQENRQAVQTAENDYACHHVLSLMRQYEGAMRAHSALYGGAEALEQAVLKELESVCIEAASAIVHIFERASGSTYVLFCAAMGMRWCGKHEGAALAFVKSLRKIREAQWHDEEVWFEHVLDELKDIAWDSVGEHVCQEVCQGLTDVMVSLIDCPRFRIREREGYLREQSIRGMWDPIAEIVKVMGRHADPMLFMLIEVLADNGDEAVWETVGLAITKGPWTTTKKAADAGYPAIRSMLIDCSCAEKRSTAALALMEPTLSEHAGPAATTLARMLAEDDNVKVRVCSALALSGLPGVGEFEHALGIYSGYEQALGHLLTTGAAAYLTSLGIDFDMRH